MNHLLRREHTTGMPSHAVGDDRERNPPALGMRNKRNPILLFLSVTLMLGNTGINNYWHYDEPPEAGRISRLAESVAAHGTRQLTTTRLRSTDCLSSAGRGR
jgi:hypothetical protein